MPPAGPRAQGWTGKCKCYRCGCRAEAGGSSSRHRPGQVLADLTPWVKVVQTVVCSTFTQGAKPATRRVADGERMNPQGKGGAFAPMQKTTGTKATSHDGRQASDHRRRARCVPDRPAIRGISRLLRDRSPIYLTCGRADQPTPADDLLSSGSAVPMRGFLVLDARHNVLLTPFRAISSSLAKSAVRPITQPADRSYPSRRNTNGVCSE